MRSCHGGEVLITVLVSCTQMNGPSEGTNIDDPPTDGLTFDEQPLDTGWLPGDYGYWHYTYDGEIGTAYASAIAVANAAPLANLSECAVRDVPCLPPLPTAEDTFVDLVPRARVDLDALRTRYLGETPSFGPFGLLLQQTSDAAAITYGTGVPAAVIEDTQVGVAFAGAWPETVTGPLLEVSPPIELVSPGLRETVQFINGDQVAINWVPTGTGIVILELTSPFGVSRWTRLIDDGSFTFDVDSYPWTVDYQTMTFSLQRWDVTTTSLYGHTIEMVAQSIATFEGEYFNVTDRSRLTAPNSCVSIPDETTLPVGSWWDTFEGYGNNVTFPDTCAGRDAVSLPGRREAIHRVDVPPGARLTIDYTDTGDPAFITLAQACDFGTSCVVQGLQTVEYVNPNDTTEPLYVILEQQAEGSFYTLDVDLTF